jgi:hypothetical protein
MTKSELQIFAEQTFQLSFAHNPKVERRSRERPRSKSRKEEPMEGLFFVSWGA